jgi:ribonuclease P protein component
VGKRVGNAVTRNRVRRRLRAAVQDHAGLLDPGCAYLIGAGPGARDASYAELQSSLGEALAELPGLPR